MNQERALRLQKKYAGSSAGPQKKEMSVGRRGPSAMGAHGKPKNAGGTFLRLVKYLSREKGRIILAAVMTLLYSVSTLAASYMLRPIINRFIYLVSDREELGTRVAGFAAALGLLALVYSVSVLTQWLQQRIMLSVSQRSLRRMRRELFDHLQTLPISYFDNHGTGDIMSRFARYLNRSML